MSSLAATREIVAVNPPGSKNARERLTQCREDSLPCSSVPIFVHTWWVQPRRSDFKKQYCGLLMAKSEALESMTSEPARHLMHHGQVPIESQHTTRTLGCNPTLTEVTRAEDVREWQSPTETGMPSACRSVWRRHPTGRIVVLPFRACGPSADLTIDFGCNAAH